MKLERIQRKTLVQSATEKLLDFIREGEITPGQKLPSERELMEALGIGRSSLREALRSLMALEILETRPGKGYFVQRLKPAGIIQPEALGALIEAESLSDLVEAREILEMQIIALAAQRATEEDVSNLRQLLEKMKSALARGQKVYRMAADFHVVLARATHNNVLVRIMQTLSSLLRTRGERIEKLIPNRSQREVELHEELYQAIVSKDLQRCTEAMQEHLADARDTILCDTHFVRRTLGFEHKSDKGGTDGCRHTRRRRVRKSTSQP